MASKLTLAWGAAAALTLTLAGCGRSPCEAMRDMLRACNAHTATELDVEACDRVYEACTGSEKDQIVKFNDCIATKAKCSDDASTFCAPELDGVSQACMPRG